MPETAPEPKKLVKPKRKYNRKPSPPVTIQANPTIAALEKDVLDLVGQRLAVITEITAANVAVTEANLRLQAAQQRIKQLEYEVGYRLNLIRQMKGEPSVRDGMALQMIVPTSNELPQYGPIVSEGVGSIAPAPPAPRQVHTGPRIRSESAEDVRAEAIQARAAI